MIDGTRAVRPGEELDVARLAAWLGRGPVEIEQFPGGHSNLTYLVRVGEAEYVLRRPPFGSKVKSAHDMGREFRILSKLAPVWSKAPRPSAFCEDESVIGAQFYLMERRRGVILRKEVPQGITIDSRAVAFALVDTLVELHAIDWRRIGLDDGANPEGYLQRQVSGWTKRWHAAKTDEIPELDAVAKWLADAMPVSPAPAIIHNDFKHDNVIFDSKDLARVVGVLDWEMATIGDPLADWGTTLSYWVQADDPQPLQMLRFGPTTLAGTPTREEISAHYAEKSGRDLSQIKWYFVLGIFKGAVVGQQIYFRFRQGLTQDDRFAALLPLVQLSAQRAAELAGIGS
jgi:aminoglycoside phosphotransferase (APT) family kinase protein